MHRTVLHRAALIVALATGFLLPGQWAWGQG